MIVAMTTPSTEPTPRRCLRPGCRGYFTFPAGQTTAECGGCHTVHFLDFDTDRYQRR